jgi:gas vesicle protein
VALYVPAGRRRRNLILGLVGALIVGLVIGGIVGRVTAPTVSDKVSTVQNSAREITARLQATPIEYAKQLSGSSEFKRGGTVLQSLEDAQQSMNGALDDAVWLGPSQRKELEDALGAVITGAKAKVPAARYEKLVTDAATRINEGFGIDAPAG